MAFNTFDIHGQRSTDRHQSDQCDSAANSLPAGTAVTLDGVLINNTTNTHKVYVKIYNNASPSVGTTAPDCVLVAGPSSTVSYTFSFGISFSNFSFACVKEAGTAGVSNPDNDVIVSCLTH
jgi:hypothetical protein